jgi:hypothetical protein
MKNKFYLSLGNRSRGCMVRVIAQRQSIAQVCGPFSLHTDRFMNAIAAHKHELERLIRDLSGDMAFSEINFVALVDAYITRLDANCPDISACVNPPLARINGELNMEPTLTQNCALYYVQHRPPKRRAALFREFRAAARKQALLSYSPHATNFSIGYRRHRDNGR